MPIETLPSPLSSNCGSGMSMPCSRMHWAKSSIACWVSASVWRRRSVVVAPLAPPPSDATCGAVGAAPAAGGEQGHAGEDERADARSG